MRRTSVFTWILILCFSTISVQSDYDSQHDPQDPKFTNLHFFLHEALAGNNATVAMIAQSKVTVDGLTVIIAGRNTPPSVLLYFDFGFTTGKFNGSSISVLSRNPTADMERELSVVGGRGKFRMAKGFAHLKVYSENATALIAELNVTIIHYEGRSEF
ncbi:hypothetical protein V6N13_069268 [Hibiscus sabdariffa]|uniref:Dirigent protein n=1 Tax=Hibiscus sabdariffa TaxID=183260 RepID=A0ABR2PG36_9ROSI